MTILSSLPVRGSPHAALPLRARDAQSGSCSGCSCNTTWLSAGLDDGDLGHLETVISARRRVTRGTMLFKAGDPFHAIYAIRRGCMKSVVARKGGAEQVSGFYMVGELLGLDGMGRGRYDCSAIALDDTEVCVLPFPLLEQLAHERPSFQHRLYSVLSREISRNQNVMLLLGTMRAEERLAAFLLSLSSRFARRGHSPSEFSLRMTREDIGSYLGLTLETISRLFGRFRNAGLLQIDQRKVRICDHAGLKALLSEGGTPAD
ncbi:MAG: cyclic nucleotide-binding domain-containing protein [Betaproteobacteria bacterium]|nr:MAG: cyclic nucleotide-binding domain-containing protein [Betaproteobacteria bacterium]